MLHHVYTLVSVLLGIISTWAGQRLVTRRIHEMDTEQRNRYKIPLYDELHQHLPDTRGYRWVADYINVAYQVFAVFILPIHLHVLVATLGLQYTCRAACFCCTPLPNCRIIIPDPPIRISTNRSSFIVLKEWIENLLRLERVLRTGLNHHDLIFSGHCTMTLSICCHWSLYLPLTRSMMVLIWGVAIFMSLSIISSRNHYTIDVLVSWLFVTFFYSSVAPRLFPWLILV